MFKEKIQAIPVDEKTEMDLRVCSVLLEQCFCDLDNIFGREHRIISLVNKKNISNDDFYEKVNKIFDDEIKKLNKFSSDSFYDQTFKTVKVFLIDIKNELGRLKTSLDQQLGDVATLSNSEHQLKYSPNNS